MADRLKRWKRYNLRTRDAIDELIDEVPEQLVHVAIEHRLMHVETLAYILHQLPYDRKIAPAAEAPAEPVAAREHWMIDIPAGVAQLGLRGDGFGWDNEFDAHEMDVPAFSMAKHKVTNGEYLEFVRQGAPAPFFWVRRGGEWFQRGMFAEFPLPLDWPVYATYEQAQAYAKRRGAALADRGAVPSRGVFGQRRRAQRPRKFGFPAMGSGSRPGGRFSGRGSFPVGGQRLGVDLDGVRAVPGVYAVSLLSKLFGAIFRWTALCSEGRFSRDCGAAGAALVPQLVPAGLSLCLCDIPAG